MEAFESFVAVALEAEGFVVSSAVKFPVTRKTKKASHDEVQTHGYEVDLVAARADRLVLATVKSFFGSRGVAAEHVMGNTDGAAGKGYALLNDPMIRDGVVAGAAARYGYPVGHVQLRLYVGRSPLRRRSATMSPRSAPGAHRNALARDPSRCTASTTSLTTFSARPPTANTETTLCLSR